MFFLLRTAFWLSLVLILLPTFTGQSNTAPAATSPSMSASEAVSAASATVSDLTGFCGRQPEACTVGAQAAAALGEKAQAGAKILYDYLNDRMNPKATGSVASNGSAAATPRKAVAGSRDTLNAADRAPAWRGPAARKEAQNNRAG
jgi:type IV secretory pathway TrbL component